MHAARSAQVVLILIAADLPGVPNKTCKAYHENDKRHKNFRTKLAQTQREREQMRNKTLNSNTEELQSEGFESPGMRKHRDS